MKIKIFGYICTKDLTGIAISLNKWWKINYAEYKMRVVSKKEFEQVKINYLIKRLELASLVEI